MDNAVAAIEVSIESRSAVRDDCVVRSDHASVHGTRHKSPMNGSAKNTIAITASAMIAAGGRRKPTDRRRDLRVWLMEFRIRSLGEFPDLQVR